MLEHHEAHDSAGRRPRLATPLMSWRRESMLHWSSRQTKDLSVDDHPRLRREDSTRVLAKSEA
jgi:hypothetical protein